MGRSRKITALSAEEEGLQARLASKELYYDPPG